MGLTNPKGGVGGLRLGTNQAGKYRLFLFGRAREFDHCHVDLPSEDDFEVAKMTGRWYITAGQDLGSKPQSGQAKLPSRATLVTARAKRDAKLTC